MPRQRPDLLKQLVRQERNTFTSRISFFRSQVMYRLISVVPARYRWLVPGLRDYAMDLFRQQQVEAETVSAPAGEVGAIAVPPIHDTLPLPALAEKAQILGLRGRYCIRSLHSIRGQGRLYEAIQVANEQPVVIREYLLPRQTFNAEEVRLRKEGFMVRGGLSLADGRNQNFRLVEPWEAIADEKENRCYLISRGKADCAPTLRQHLMETGAMAARSVRQVLDQVLQTLEALHGQKFRLPGGQIQQGIAHGNLSLDSLLILPMQEIIGAGDRPFYIYVTDLHLWESLFDAPSTVSLTPTVQKDLEALGYLGFHLLRGRWADAMGQPLDPRDTEHWFHVDRPLQQFLMRLMGLDLPFENATAARQALLALPEAPPAEAAFRPVEEAVVPRPRQRKWLKWLLLALLGGLLTVGLWHLLPRLWTPAIAQQSPYLCCIRDVAGLPEGSFRLAAEQSGSWTFAYQKPGLIAQDQTLEGELRSRRPKLADLKFRQYATGEAAIEAVRAEAADVAVTSLAVPGSELRRSKDLGFEDVAYDGLTAFVAFSYAARENSLPRYLDGRISLEQLRLLYTGQVSNWRELGGPDLPVKLYIPQEAEAIAQFERQVLQDEEAIAQFRSLISHDSDSNTDTFVGSEKVGSEKVGSENVGSEIGSEKVGSEKMSSVSLTQLSTTEALRAVIRDFEADEIGGIAFGTISKVFGQCSAYPLAIATPSVAAVQPLLQDNQQPITPDTDLCNDKGSYHPNAEAFRTQRYPLAYPLTVVYPRDNSRPEIGKRFAAILKTTEAQQLLAKTGLVPLR